MLIHTTAPTLLLQSAVFHGLRYTVSGITPAIYVAAARELYIFHASKYIPRAEISRTGEATWKSTAGRRPRLRRRIKLSPRYTRDSSAHPRERARDDGASESASRQLRRVSRPPPINIFEPVTVDLSAFAIHGATISGGA